MEDTARKAAEERTFLVDGAQLAAPAPEAGLYVVATPIGNLEDVTLRALRTLAGADLIACEDTRVTGVLLARYGIAARLLSYNDHNAPERRPRILGALAAGKAVALASDAGTPLVSDPGYRLVAEAIAAGHRVVPVPGPSALTAALSAAGLPTDAFLFAGFLPTKRAARRRRLAALAAVPATLVFYEARQRVADTLADMAAVLGGEREGAAMREITKRHEEAVRGSLAALSARYAAGAQTRGEFVLLAGPPAPAAAPSQADVDALLAEALSRASTRDAAAEVAALTGLPRRDLYRRAMALKDG